MIVYTINIAGYDIDLHETRRVGRPAIYMVAYGQQIKDNLDYWGACKELGSCIMHALACEGKLESEE